MTESRALSSETGESAVQPVVRIRGLNHTFGTGDVRQQVLFDLNLDVQPGALVIMTGASGCGKTTLLTLIGALRSVQEGNVQVMGRELRGLGKKERIHVRRDVGFIFQAHNLLEALSAWRNVNLALTLKDYTADSLYRHAGQLLTILKRDGVELPSLNRLPRSKPAVARALAWGLLTILNLGAHLDKKPNELSGGQKQRVAIGRALVNGPRLILADEPTAALDKDSGEIVIDVLKKLAANGSTILVVTHDNRIMDRGDRIVHIKDGRIESDIQVNHITRICLFLHKVPLFTGLTPSALVDVGVKMQLEKYEPGTRIIRQGDVGDKFYLLQKGAVDVIVNEGQPAQQLLSTLGPGQFFGEVAIVEDTARTATIVAREAVEVYTLQKAEFQQALAGSETMREELIKVFAQRHRTP